MDKICGIPIKNEYKSKKYSKNLHSWTKNSNFVHSDELIEQKQRNGYGRKTR